MAVDEEGGGAVALEKETVACEKEVHLENLPTERGVDGQKIYRRKRGVDGQVRKFRQGGAGGKDRWSGSGGTRWVQVV